MTLPALSIVISGHYPFLPVPAKDDPVSQEERLFFESLSESYLPLLEAFERMEARGVPFRLGMALSYSFCSLLKSERVMERYHAWLESRIAFGRREQKRTTGEQRALAAFYLDRDIERRDALIMHYGMDLAAAFEKFQNRGRIELLGGPATPAFLPFFASIPEAIQAQIETGLVCHRKLFNKTPGGFWLPDL
ncbi:MAG: DUF1957 domain-containing protein, partial [Treponema sp.]|nr:DUF1957 domain-containing protein [Treponema sp.]